MDILGDTSSCMGCSNTVKVYYYPSNGPITSGEQLNSANYILIDSPSFGATSQTKSLTFSLASQFDRFYIAIVEENSCFTLRRLRVSYAVCPMETVGLVVYPNTPIGASAVTGSASCKPNAAVSVGGSLSFTCDTDGTFSGSPSCSCVSGHFQSGESCYGELYNIFCKLILIIARVLVCTESNHKILLSFTDASAKMRKLLRK